MKNLNEVEKIIGIKFNNPSIIETAFIHRSFLNENRGAKEHNERLEFLGDAVLELVVTEHLYKNYKNPEGDMTNWRSALVKTESISMVARNLGFEKYLEMSKGEKQASGRSRQLILANTFEAVVGAIYLDQGYEKASSFIRKQLISGLPRIIEEKLYIDSKSHFQEIAQEKEGITPRYEVLSEEGPDHDKKFKIAVKIGEKRWGVGIGSSKQLAQQAAAQDAIKNYQN